jgi:hypothetical protein
MQNLKNYNNEEIWNSLNFTWKKYFINFHHFKNSSNYHPNYGIHLKVFQFPQKITLPQNIPHPKLTLSGLTFETIKIYFDKIFSLNFFASPLSTKIKSRPLFKTKQKYYRFCKKKQKR